MNESTPAVEVTDLVKKYKEVVAVDGVSFDIPSGQLFGMLGPNGAGKTTTLGMLSTLRKPTSGSARVFGHDVVSARAAVRQRIGIVFQDFTLDDKLSGRENLDFHGRLYGMSGKDRRRRIEEVLELVDLRDKSKVLVEKYSGGMKRRLEIARGLMHAPPLLFLDEPTLGLDAQTRRQIWEYLAQLNRDVGVTMILTTHYMEEAEELCERVAIVDHGKIVTCDSPDALKASVGGDAVSLEVEGEEVAVEALVATLEERSFIGQVQRDGSSLELATSEAERRVPELVDAVRGAGAVLTSLRFRKPNLEDVFLYYTGRQMRDAVANGADALAVGRAQRRR